MKAPYKVVAVFAGATLLVVLVVILSFSNFNQMEEAAAARKHTYISLISANDLLTDLVDAETGQRGFLLTGDETFLQQYLDVRNKIRPALDNLRQDAFISDAQKHLDALSPLIEAKMAEMQYLIELRRNREMNAVTAAISSARGKRLMDSIRVELSNFNQIQESARIKHDADFRSNMRHLFTSIVVASLFTLLFALTFAYLVYRNSRQRLANLVQLETTNLLEIQTVSNTKLERTNAALQISEGKLAVTLHSIADGVITTDAEGRVTLLNPLAERLTGWSHSEAVGYPIEDIFHIINQETRQPSPIPIKETLASGAIQGLTNHIVLVALDGTECPIADSCAPIRDANDQVIGAVLVFRDVTADYAAQKALQQYRDHLEEMVHERTSQLENDVINRKQMEDEIRRLATVVKDSNDAITIQDFEGRITAWNHGAELMYGYSEEEALLMNIGLLTAPDKLAEQMEFTRRLIAGEKITSFETQRITKDGRVLDVWMVVTKLMDDAGKPIGIASTERDISARKREEENLRRFATVVKDSNDAITIHDFDGGITAWNRGAELMYGYSEKEALQMNIGLLTIPGKAAEQKEFTRRLIEGENITSFETQRVTKDGHVLDVWMVVTKLMDDAGKPIGIASTERDITERKQAEKEHERMQSELRQAQKMEAIGRLAGGVAHDFNNMLSIILGYADLVMSKMASDDPLYKSLYQIRLAGERSADLTKQLLAFSRKQTAVPRVVKLEEVVANEKKMLGRLIGEDISLTVTTTGNLWNIRIDPSQIDQILANLIVNARDAIAGVGTVTIEMANSVVDETMGRHALHAAPGDYVMMAVRDTGSGMDNKTIDNIFEPFFTTKEEGKGTGLGLATVFGIVKQNHGIINVYSEPGLGATFRIYFPRFLGEVEEAAEKVKTAPPTGNETILIAEDEKAVLNLVVIILEESGYHVLSASDPGDAVKLAVEYKGDIHLLLTDIVMPTMNGKELNEKLRLIRPDIKTLFMSGYTSDIIADRGLVDEGVNFIHKPISSEALVRKVREVLDARLDLSGSSQI